MMSVNVIRLPTAALRPVRQPATRTDATNVVQFPRQPEIVDRDSPRGTPAGYREMIVHTHRETKAWRALAGQHAEARNRLHACLIIKAGELPWEGRLDLSDETTQAALTAYREVCKAVLQYPDPKPRHLRTMLRAAAEVSGLGEPTWMNWRPEMGQAIFALGLVDHAIFRMEWNSRQGAR